MSTKEEREKADLRQRIETLERTPVPLSPLFFDKLNNLVKKYGNDNLREGVAIKTERFRRRVMSPTIQGSTFARG